MKLVIIFFMSSACSLCFAEDDWMGSDDQGVLLGFRYGSSEGESTNLSLNATLPFIYHSQLHGNYSTGDSDDQDQSESYDLWSLHWNSDNLQSWVLGLGYEKSGEGSMLESTDLQMSLQFNTENLWYFKGKYLEGDIDIGIDDLSSEVSQEFEGLGLLRTQRQGYGLLVGYDNYDWGFRIATNHYDYDAIDTPRGSQESINTVLTEEASQEAYLYIAVWYRSIFNALLARGLSEDDARSTTNRYFEERSQEIQTRLNEWVGQRARAKQYQTWSAYYFAVDQQSILSLYDASIEAYSAHKNLTFFLGALRYKSYIEEHLDFQYYGGIDIELANGLVLGSLLSYAVGSSEVYSEVFLSVAW